MRRLSWLTAAAILWGGGSAAFGQVPAPTTVQLPTFHVFTVQTTVSVPDRGGMALGGITRGADGRVQLGPLGNRASSSSRGAGGLSASATILDNRELDETVLAAAERVSPGGGTATKAAELSRGVAKEASARQPGSVAAIREQNAVAEQERNAEFAAVLAKGAQAEARGQMGLAKTYYRMVARQANGEIKQRAEGLLVALATGQATASAAATKR